MLFSSIPFLYYFLPLVLVCYFCVPFRWKNFILLFFSLIFYSWGEPRYIFLMVLSILLGYIEGILIERKKHSRLILAGACCIHLGLLMYFKYVDFLIRNLNAIGLSIPLFHIALPIGISFYTFQILSYLIDVYRKDCTAQTNLISFGAYVSMFPQLIAGPIVRYKDIAAQLEVRKHIWIIQKSTSCELSRCALQYLSNLHRPFCSLLLAVCIFLCATDLF